MEIASAWVVINGLGSNVPKHGITPAEAILLRNKLQPIIGGNPVTQIEVTGEAVVATEWDEVPVAEGSKQMKSVVTKTRPRTSEDEYNRLVNKYGETAVKAAWPGDPSGVTLPESFEKAKFELGAQWQQVKKVDPARMTRALKDDDMVFIEAPSEA